MKNKHSICQYFKYKINWKTAGNYVYVQYFIN